MNIDFVVVTYGFYLAISIALTIWVARTLFATAESSWSMSSTAMPLWRIRSIISWWSASIWSTSAM